MMCKIPLHQSNFYQQAPAQQQQSESEDGSEQLSGSHSGQDIYKPNCLLVNDSPFLLMAYKEQLSEQF